MLLQLAPQLIDVDFGVGCKVSAEVILTVQFADNDLRLPYMRLRGDKSLDLTQLYAESSELDLIAPRMITLKSLSYFA